MNLTDTHLVELRAYLKGFVVAAQDESATPQAEALNALIPAIVDAISDDELTIMTNQTWGFVLESILASNTAPPEGQHEEEPEPPRIILN